jgi:hypothetical protein
MHLNIAVEALTIVWRLRAQHLLGRLKGQRIQPVAPSRRSPSTPS